MLVSQSLHAIRAPFAWRVAHPHYDDHENDLIEAAPGGSESGVLAHTVARGESGALTPRTMALFAAGFVLGAVAIGAVGLVGTPVDPPAVRPIELRSPDQSDRTGDGADRRRDRSERRRGSGGREPVRPRGSSTPARPRSGGQTRVQPAPPTAAPRPRTTAPRPTPGPRRQPRAQPTPTPAQPAPAPAPTPPADEDEADGDADLPSEDAGDAGGATGELDNDVD
jgi:hypothetical protein